MDLMHPLGGFVEPDRRDDFFSGVTLDPGGPVFDPTGPLDFFEALGGLGVHGFLPFHFARPSNHSALCATGSAKVSRAW